MSLYYTRLDEFCDLNELWQNVIPQYKYQIHVELSYLCHQQILQLKLIHSIVSMIEYTIVLQAYDPLFISIKYTAISV